MLSSILDKHEMIRCEGELMHPGAIGRTAGAIENPNLIWEILSNESMPHAAAGFKLSAQHFVDLNVNISDWISRLGAEKIIFISRQNLLEQYVSVRLAVINNAWTSSEGLYSTDQVTIDFDDFDLFVSNILISNNMLRGISSDYCGLNVTYEEILEQPLQISNNILRYLGAGGGSNFEIYGNLDLDLLPFKKQRSRSLTDTILNFAEVRSRYPEMCG